MVSSTLVLSSLLCAKDRSDGRGGGVFIIVKKCFAIVPLMFGSKYDLLEVTGFDFVNVLPPVRVLVVYRPTYYDHMAVNLASTFIEFLTEHATSCCQQHVIVGDLNLPRIDWQNLTCPHENIHTMVFDFVVKYGFSQTVNSSTRGDNALDVILTDDDMLISNLTLSPPVGQSDHSVIEFVLAINICGSTSTTTTCSEQNTHGHKWHLTDFESMSMHLLNIDCFSSIHNNPSTECMWNVFCAIINDAINMFVPAYSIRHHLSKPHVQRTLENVLLKRGAYGKNSA